MDFAKIMKDEINRKRKKLDSDLKVNKDNKKGWILLLVNMLLYWTSRKVGCVIPMALVSISPHANFGANDGEFC